MVQRPFTFASAVSLLMLVATVVIWFGEFDTALAVGNHYTTVDVQTHDGVHASIWKFTFDVKEISEIDRPFLRFSCDNWSYFGLETVGYDGNEFAAARTRFFSQPRHQGLGISRYFVKCPYWFVVVVCSILPALWLMRRRVGPGHCAHCAYDLTGNTSGVCPECGAAVAPDAVRGSHANTRQD